MEESRGLLFRPRALVVRELDSLAFDAVVLRGTPAGGSGLVDLAYLDDGNIERCIPVEELSSPTSNSSSLGEGAESAEELEDDALWQCLLQRLVANDAKEPKEPTTPSTVASEEDRLVIEDGTVILNGAVSALSSDQVLEEGKTLPPVGGQEAPAATEVPSATAVATGEEELVVQHLEVVTEDSDEQSNSGSQGKEGREEKPVAAAVNSFAMECARNLPACRVGLRGIRSLRVRRQHGKGPLTVPLTPR